MSVFFLWTFPFIVIVVPNESVAIGQCSVVKPLSGFQQSSEFFDFIAQRLNFIVLTSFMMTEIFFHAFNATCGLRKRQKLGRFLFKSLFSLPEILNEGGGAPTEKDKKFSVDFDSELNSLFGRDFWDHGSPRYLLDPPLEVSIVEPSHRDAYPFSKN